VNTNDPELLKLAKLAVERQDAEKRMLEKMCPACRRAYDEAWAERVAKASVRMGEAETDERTTPNA